MVGTHHLTKTLLRGVLIPLRSGHGLDPELFTGSETLGLNPFEIRAWFGQKSLWRMGTSTVLIPLRSGHGLDWGGG